MLACLYFFGVCIFTCMFQKSVFVNCTTNFQTCHEKVYVNFSAPLKQRYVIAHIHILRRKQLQYKMSSVLFQGVINYDKPYTAIQALRANG